MYQRVVFVTPTALAHGHDALTKASLAASLARLLGIDYGGAVEPCRTNVEGAYAVPGDTLTLDQAHGLGIHGPHQLFGGVVPRPFVATKIITHPLITADAAAPDGWAPAFAESVAPVVLEGWSAFTAADARQACSRLLQAGSVRIKDAGGVGGSGQAVVRDLRQFDNLLESPEFAGAWRGGGLVLERNLRQVRTVSVGQAWVGPWLISYHGEQRLTRNRFGKEVYGGSSLHVVRGDFDALLREPLSDGQRLAVEQAVLYHRAALAAFDGLYASRSNYDVVQGVDDGGVWRSGVLEQSWRIGGASGAEIAALHALRERPALHRVKASTHEIHGEDATVPPGAELHYDAHDERVGRLLKYALVEDHGDARGRGPDPG